MAVSSVQDIVLPNLSAHFLEHQDQVGRQQIVELAVHFIVVVGRRRIGHLIDPPQPSRGKPAGVELFGPFYVVQAAGVSMRVFRDVKSGL
jgi:hypothetical protein